MLRNLLGLSIGFVIINSIIFLVSYCLQTGQNVAAMFGASGISFFAFIGSQFLPIPLLKRIFGLGLVLGFMGGFLAGLFHANYLDAQFMNTFQSVPTYSVTQKPNIDTAKSPYFRLKDYKILDNYKTKYTKRNRSDTQDYYIMPIVATHETINDSIFWWVGFRYRESLGGESYQDYMHYILSKKAIAKVVLDSHDSLNFAAAIRKATASRFMQVSKLYVVLEMTDTQMQEDFNKRQFQYTWLIINMIWLVVGVSVIMQLKFKDDSKML
jgi:hypothetical protein